MTKCEVCKSNSTCIFKIQYENLHESILTIKKNIPDKSKIEIKINCYDWEFNNNSKYASIFDREHNHIWNID